MALESFSPGHLNLLVFSLFQSGRLCLTLKPLSFGVALLSRTQAASKERTGGAEKEQTERLL